MSPHWSKTLPTHARWAPSHGRSFTKRRRIPLAEPYRMPVLRWMDRWLLNSVEALAREPIRFALLVLLFEQLGENFHDLTGLQVQELWSRLRAAARQSNQGLCWWNSAQVVFRHRGTSNQPEISSAKPSVQMQILLVLAVSFSIITFWR